MEDTYLTLPSMSEGLYKDKGSKFYSFAFPVSTKEQIKSIVEDFRKKYHDARHVCYAYRIHPTMIETRANDDGEPSGTAGKPILGVLVSKDLVNVLVVVVRYFGGTLLGTSGLITAYREATLDAIDHNEIIEKKVEVSFTIYFGYLVMNDVMKIIKDENPTVLEQTFDNDCKMLLQIRVRDYDKIINRLQKVEGLKIE
ncbi:MAG: YigZ family protein [Paludibacteraceae bacterium]|nr:YigZ family protein [Paludibacteraceae bacterium]MEE3482752.1 YigZ family protein [Bacteroidales bacterium]